MKRKAFLFLFSFLFLKISAQLCTNELPVSFYSTIDEQEIVERKCMPDLDMTSIEKEDKDDAELGYPPRFGFSHFVDYNLENSGTWQKLSNGDRIWRLIIFCPQALSINLLYDKFWIPEGGKFYVYTSDRKQCLGAFTNKNNQGDRDNIKEYATGFLFSDEITLEYYQPRNVKEEAIISIASIVHGYKSLGLGASGSCQVNVNCSEGDNWQNEKKAVAMILVNGERLCTGSLIQTTSVNNAPVFLTANHCIQGYGDAVSSPSLNNWSFYWNYEAPGCSNISYEPNYTYTVGATVLANNSSSDFALLQLTENPQSVCNPSYLGWDRSGNSGIGGVCIHHPSGDLKKISTFTMSPISTFYFTYSINGNHWLVNWHSTVNGYGTTEGGSSGSALLNNNHHVIGQLHGGLSSCSNQSGADWYGRFDVSWTGGGHSYDRLSNWLDPTGWGLTVMPSSADLIISGDEHLYNTGIYSLSSLPSGMSVNWFLTGDNAADYIIEANTPSINQCRITQKTDVDINGSASLTLTAQIMYGGSLFYTANKNLTGHYINGPMVPCGTTFYYVDPLPANHTVEWEAVGQNLEYDYVQNGTIPQDLYPYVIIHQQNERHYGTLTASVKSGNTVVGTLVKQIDTAGGFSGTWYQEPSQLDSTNAVPQSFTHMSDLEIVLGRRVYLTSDHFLNSTITDSGNGFLLFDWSNSNGVISFIPLAPINTPPGQILIKIISGSSSNGCKSFSFTLTRAPQLMTPISLSANSKEGTCQFTISESEEAISSFYTRLDMSSEWRLTVVRSDTGRTVYDSSVSGTSKTVGTTGWSPGIYIAVAQVDGQYVSSKFVVSK